MQSNTVKTEPTPQGFAIRKRYLIAAFVVGTIINLSLVAAILSHQRAENAAAINDRFEHIETEIEQLNTECWLAEDQQRFIDEWRARAGSLQIPNIKWHPYFESRWYRRQSSYQVFPESLYVNKPAYNKGFLHPQK